MYQYHAQTVRSGPRVQTMRFVASAGELGAERFERKVNVTGAVKIDRIGYRVRGGSVVLYWAGGEIIAILSGEGEFDFGRFGGMLGDQSIHLSTQDFGVGSGYTIDIELSKGTGAVVEAVTDAPRFAFPMGGNPGAVVSADAVSSEDLVLQTNSATLEIGAYDVDRRVWATVMVSTTQDSGFGTTGGPVAALHENDNVFPSRSVELYEITGASGTTVAAAWGGDAEYVATFRTIGLQPKTGGAISVGRQNAVNTTSTVVAVVVPTGGALLMHGKRYDGIATSGPAIVVDEALSGTSDQTSSRAVWYNNLGSQQSFNVTFSTATSGAEKYGMCVVFENP